jgi:glycosyltransferase involved in cell wall biosynthesis
MHPFRRARRALPVGSTVPMLSRRDARRVGSDQPQSRLRVTIVSHAVGFYGGTELHMAQLVSGLAARGISVTVISHTLTPREAFDVTWVRVRCPPRPFPLTYLWFFAVATVLVRRHRGNIVHSNNAVIANKSDVLTVHHVQNALRDHGVARSQSRDDFLHRLNAAIAGPLKRTGERVCYRPRLIRAAVTNTTGTAAEVSRLFPALNDRIHVIPPGADHVPSRKLSEDSIAPLPNFTSGDLLAVFVGGDWERKRPWLAVEALTSASGWHLAVLGSGDGVALKALARERGVGGRVHILGVVPDVFAWLHRADAFVLPTLYETFCFAAYEAAACALPLVVGRVDGTESLVVDGANGWFVDSATEISRALDLLRDPATRQRLGQAAAASSKEYTWARFVDRYAALYRSLLSTAGLGS